jgi:hypothetical protein
MAGGERSITGDGKERSGDGGEGAADGDNHRKTTPRAEEAGQEKPKGGKQPDTADQRGEPEGGAKSSGTGTNGQEDGGRTEGDPEPEKQQVKKADAIYLIYEDSANNRPFSVVKRWSMADIAQEVKNLTPGQQEHSVVIKGEFVTFSMETQTVFKFSDGEVLLT